MRILIYTHEFPPFQGGIATSAKMIADILSSENEVTVLCPNYGYKTVKESDNFSTERINFLGGKHFKKIPIIQYILGLLKIKKILKSFKPEKIFFLGEEAELVGGLLNEKKIDQIIRIAGSGIESIIKNKALSKTLYKFLLKRLYKNSKYIIAVSRNTKRLMEEEEEFFSKKKIKLIYNGIDSNFTQQDKDPNFLGYLRDSNETLILLTVSRLLPRKGQDYVIKALGKIRNKNIKYVCVGEGSHLRKYKSLVKSLNLESSVSFPGGIERSQVHKYYDSADVFILCNRTWNSKIEGLPNVAIESMSRSTPVIGSKNSGTEELIKPSKNGYLVDSEDVDDIAHIIELTYKNKKNLREMGNSAMLHISENFSFESMKANYLNLVKDE